MRPATLLGLLAVIVLLGGTLLVGLGDTPTKQTSLTEEWLSDTGRDVYGNHHAPAVARLRDHAQVFVPISGRTNTSNCGLVALTATTGEQEWTAAVPPQHCTIHAVADPTVGQIGPRRQPLVFAATTEKALIGVDASSGQERFRTNLSTYGYTQPLLVDITNDSRNEIIVVDVQGSVYAFAANGSSHWRHFSETYTWARPTVIQQNDSHRIILGLGNGTVYHFTAAGAIKWSRRPTTAAITWMSPDRTTPDQPIVSLATTDGDVITMNGTTGSVVWRKQFDEFTAVHIPQQTEQPESAVMYATAADGVIRQLDLETGTVRWSTTLTNDDVQMTPPPRQGDLDGDGIPEIVAVTNAGGVYVLAPESGDILASHTRDVPIYTHPVLADTNGDGSKTIHVIYGDGRVLALNYTTKS